MANPISSPLPSIQTFPAALATFTFKAWIRSMRVAFLLGPVSVEVD